MPGRCVTAGTAAAHRPGRYREHEVQEGEKDADEPTCLKVSPVQGWDASTVRSWSGRAPVASEWPQPPQGGPQARLYRAR